MFGLFGSLSPATAAFAVALIAGIVIAVGVPAGSIVNNLPALAATVRSVAKVAETTAFGPMFWKPFLHLTGPENVVFAIIFSLYSG